MNTARIAEIVRTSSLPDENKQGLIAALVVWFDKYPTLPHVTIKVEHEFCLRVADLKGRPFDFVGKIDRTWQDYGVCSFDEIKTHRGPWRKGITVKIMVDDYFAEQQLSMQAHCYHKAMQLLGLSPNNEFTWRVLVKPGPYNEPSVHERLFKIYPATEEGIWQGFLKAATDARDRVFPLQPKLGCVNRYNRRCTFWQFCAHDSSKAVALRPKQQHHMKLELPADSEFVFSVSAAQAYMECPENYRYRYVERLEEDEKFLGLVEGSVFHACLEEM